MAKANDSTEHYTLSLIDALPIQALKIDDVTQLYGKPYPFEFYPKSFRDLMIKNIECARDTGKTLTQEAAVVDINGNDVWFHSTIVPIYDEDNQLEYFMVVSIDITGRKSAEIKLHQMNSKLNFHLSPIC